MTENVNIGVQEKPKLDVRMAIFNRIANTIGNNPNIERIVPAEDFNLPDINNIDYSHFDNGRLNRPQLRRKMGNLYHIIYLPYIVDKFTSAKDRDNWRITLSDKEFKAFLNNALRPQMFVGARNSVWSLQVRGGVEKDGDWGKRFHCLADSVTEPIKDLENYIKSTKDKQVTFARDFKQQIADLIKHIGTIPSK